MADQPVQLREYEVEVRPGVTTTVQLSDADAERMGVKQPAGDEDTGAESVTTGKSRPAANKSRTAEDK